MKNIRFFVSLHKPYPVPEYPLLAPIQVRAALAGKRYPGFLQDNTGENISAQNRSYCELTAQYWAWKNAWVDYYGFSTTGGTSTRMRRPNGPTGSRPSLR